jgi:hypothetical protein
MPIDMTLEELQRKWKAEDAAARHAVRLPDTDETRRALAQAHDLHRYRSRECCRCSGSFLARLEGVYPATSYCTPECQQADRNERRAEKRWRDRKPAAVDCAQCGNPVPSERSTRRYCSDACRQRAYRNAVRMRQQPAT